MAKIIGVRSKSTESPRGAIDGAGADNAHSASVLTFPAPRGRRSGWLLRGAGVLLVGGCALGTGLRPGMEAPSINVSRIRLQDSTVLEQRFLAILRVQNPNAVDLAIEGISYDLEVNGQPFAKGVGKGLVIIPAFSQGTIETEAITRLSPPPVLSGNSGRSGARGGLRSPIASRARSSCGTTRLPCLSRCAATSSGAAGRATRRNQSRQQGALSNPSTREATAGRGGGAASSDGAAPCSCLAPVAAWIAVPGHGMFLASGPSGAPPVRPGPRRSSP